MSNHHARRPSTRPSNANASVDDRDHRNQRNTPEDVTQRESPLAWLARRRDKDGNAMISEIEFAAGEKLRADFWFAQMTPRVTADWSRLLTGGGKRQGSADHGVEMHDAVAAARERVSRALAAAGPDLAGMLIDVCCHLRGLETSESRAGWPKRSGKVVLQIGLRQLARHYGMTTATQDRPSVSRTGHISHWGAADYRPRIDGDQGQV